MNGEWAEQSREEIDWENAGGVRWMWRNWWINQNLKTREANYDWKSGDTIKKYPEMKEPWLSVTFTCRYSHSVQAWKLSPYVWCLAWFWSRCCTLVLVHQSILFLLQWKWRIKYEVSTMTVEEQIKEKKGYFHFVQQVLGVCQMQCWKQEPWWEGPHWGGLLQRWCPCRLSLLSSACGYCVSFNRKAGELFSEACLYIVH